MEQKTKKKITAGLIVIGDEIIKGFTKEENSFIVCQSLFNMGIDLIKISTIGDDIDQIAQEVKEFSHRYSYVLTCGGIGPTHDDVTYEGISKALNDKLEMNEEFIEFIKSYKPNIQNIDSPFFKMAKIPSLSSLHFSKENKFPLVSVKNIYIFPGIPSLFRKDLEIFKDLIKKNSHTLPQFFNDSLYLKNTDETSIANILTQTSDEFSSKGFLKIGSYPVLKNQDYSIKVSVTSNDEDLMKKTLRQLRLLIPKEYIVDQEGILAKLQKNVPNVHDGHNLKLENLGLVLKLTQDETVSETLRQEVKKSIGILDECLQLYPFPRKVCIAFNGGKDCSVLLHLLYAVLHKNHLLDDTSLTDGQSLDKRLVAVYIRQRMPFTEVEGFIWETCRKYKLKLILLEGSYKEALASLRQQCPEMEAIIMGTRSSDPGTGALQGFSPTDPGWPKFVRVNPLLGWSYRDIWAFINYTKINYCSLYDKGYTSIGSMDDTFPNSSLRYINSHGMIDYKSAHLLEEPLHERNGRF